MINFLNPGFLWLLPLISLPLIIHLLAKRKSRLLDFPSLKFLKLLEQDALRRFNLKQLLLLIIRTLMVLLIILGFAQPTMDINSPISFSPAKSKLFIIVLDNTASSRVLFENLDKNWLESLADRLKERGYRVYFSGLDDLRLQPTTQEIWLSYAGIQALDLQQAFSDQLELESFTQRRLLWIGDGQDTQAAFASLSGWDKILLKEVQPGDAGVGEITLPGQGVRLGDRYELRTTVSRSPDFERPLGVELLINGQRQNQQVLDSGESLLTFSARVEDSGFQSGQLVVGADEHDYNDVRYFVLPAAGKVPVQILDNGHRPDFWRIIRESSLEHQLNLDLEILGYDQIDNLDLGRGGTVLVDEASRLETYNWSRLESFCRAGGQLILFGNGGTDMASLLRFEHPLRPETTKQSFGLALQDGQTGSFKVEPLRKAIQSNRIKVQKRYVSQGNELDETWVRYLDDECFLGSSSYGKGRIIWFNTDFGLSAGNLPILGMFPALIKQLAENQVLELQTGRYNAEIGDTLRFFPGNGAGNSPYSIQRPDGTMDYLAPDESYALEYALTDIPGIYVLSQGRRVIQPTAVNVSDHEARAHGADLISVADDVQLVETLDELEARIIDLGGATALWPTLFLLLLALMLLETYLSRIKSTWRDHD